MSRCFGQVGEAIFRSLPQLSLDLVDIIAGYAFEVRHVASFGKGHLQCTLFLAVNAHDEILVGGLNGGVCVLDSQGNFLRRHGEFGPGGIHCDEAGVVWFVNRCGSKDVGVWTLDAPSCSCSSVSASATLRFKTNDPFNPFTCSWMSGIAVYKEMVFVCDRFKQCVFALGRDGRMLLRIGSKDFQYPCDCIVSAGGEVFVSDWALSLILVFDVRDGTLRRQFDGMDQSSTATAAEACIQQLRNPAGLAFHNGNLLVADWGKQRVCAFRPGGTYLWSFPVPFSPWGIGVDSQGRIAACSGDNATSGTVEMYIV